MLTPPPAYTPLACRPHDHQQCISSALSAAEALCASRGLRLTTQRKRVLELVWDSHRPLGAYHILAALGAVDGRRTAPPTVYRALNFLVEHGLVHRIDSLNAFVGCNHPDHPHQGQFLICRRCHSAIELEQACIVEAVLLSAAILDFTVEKQTVEVSGLCNRCQYSA